MKEKRAYTMTARAKAAEGTRQRILEAILSLAGERPMAEITLDAIADRAQVSVKTVLRQFGSRDALIASAMQRAMAQTEDERRTPSGDIGAALTAIVDHYELQGRTALLLLSQEDRDTYARMATDQGKALHRSWVRDAFAPATDDEGLLDLLVVATDVYAWKLLRLDRGYSRAVTEHRMHSLVQAILSIDPPDEGAPPWPTSSS